MRHQLNDTSRISDRLTADWFALSHERLGTSRQTWYHPAVERIAEAVENAEPLEGPLQELAAARGNVGLDLNETLLDLEHLLEVLPPDVRSSLDALSTARCLDAWSEAFLGHQLAPACTDSLTGLATVPFLRARLEEAFRHCASLDLAISSAYALIVIHPATTSHSPFVRMTDRIATARATRARFPGGETIAMNDSGVIFVLTAAGPHLGVRADDLVDALGAETTATINRLPDDLPDLLDRFDELSS